MLHCETGVVRAEYCEDDEARMHDLKQAIVDHALRERQDKPFADFDFEMSPFELYLAAMEHIHWERGLRRLWKMMSDKLAKPSDLGAK